MKTVFHLLLLLGLPFASRGQIEAVYEAKFVAGATQHRAAIILYKNGMAKVRVRYFSEGQTKMVEQTGRCENTRAGLRIACYDPVYPGTRVRYPTYSTDNFYISQDEYGEVVIMNVDDGGSVARVSARVFAGYYERKQFLSVFGWEYK